MNRPLSVTKLTISSPPVLGRTVALSKKRSSDVGIASRSGGSRLLPCARNDATLAARATAAIIVTTAEAIRISARGCAGSRTAVTRLARLLESAIATAGVPGCSAMRRASRTSNCA